MELKFRTFTQFDFTLCISVIALTVIGILFIYSSGVNSSGESLSNEFVKQIVWAATGFILMIAIAISDYRRIADRTLLLLVLIVAVLVYTRIFGRYVSGARSWIGIGEFGVQPAEFSKVITILYLAHFLDTSQQNNAKPFARFIKAGVIAAIPMLLILSQPDLGTASVFFPIFLVMCMLAGIPLRYIVTVFLLGILSIVFTILPYWDDVVLGRSLSIMRIFTESRLILITAIILSSALAFSVAGYFFFKARYYYWIAYGAGILLGSFLVSFAAGHVLQEYQIMRLIIFINPYIDERGAGWNIIQSITAIGSGGLYGQGYLQGTQSHYRFLPQQSTDFIFSILTEEWGFVGGLVVFALYGIIFVRAFRIIRSSRDNFGSLLSGGILTMLAFHFLVNIGMTMGIMPITGIPLFFLSYGGSSLWTAMISVGFLMSVNMKKIEE